MSALEGVGVTFVERADTGEVLKAGVVNIVGNTVVGAAVPRLAVHQNTGVNLVKR